MVLRLHPLLLIIRITKIITVHGWNDNPRKKLHNRRKTCPTAALPTIKLKYIFPGLNSGLSTIRSATNHQTPLKIEIHLNHTYR
jgi:hypothetical protein